LIRVVLASANAGKLRELTALLAPLGLELIAQTSLGIESPPETGETFLTNALIKARHAAAASSLPALADDSGIEVDALGGQPGVRSARFAGEGASDAENLAKLLGELHEVPVDRRGARYRCCIVFVREPDDAQPLVADGTWEGRIITECRGSGGFGYDPVFVPTGLASTAAELAPDVKNSLSHRGQALRSLAAQLAGWLDNERGLGR
jgi:XTP/dITP diphosphohydrolase